MPPAPHALDALRRLKPPGALERVLRLARSSDGTALVEEALDALGSWPDSEPALRALLNASRSDQGWIAGAAAASLSAFRQEESTERLFELAGSPGVDTLR